MASYSEHIAWFFTVRLSGSPYMVLNSYMNFWSLGEEILECKPLSDIRNHFYPAWSLESDVGFTDAYCMTLSSDSWNVVEMLTSAVTDATLNCLWTQTLQKSNESKLETKYGFLSIYLIYTGVGVCCGGIKFPAAGSCGILSPSTQ